MYKSIVAIALVCVMLVMCMGAGYGGENTSNKLQRKTTENDITIEEFTDTTYYFYSNENLNISIAINNEASSCHVYINETQELKKYEIKDSLETFIVTEFIEEIIDQKELATETIYASEIMVAIPEIKISNSEASALVSDLLVKKYGEPNYMERLIYTYDDTEHTARVYLSDSIYVGRTSSVGIVAGTAITAVSALLGIPSGLARILFKFIVKNSIEQMLENADYRTWETKKSDVKKTEVDGSFAFNTYKDIHGEAKTGNSGQVSYVEGRTSYTDSFYNDNLKVAMRGIEIYKMLNPA